MASFETLGMVRGAVESAPCTDGGAGKVTRAWKRRAQSSNVHVESSDGDGEMRENHDRKLEDELGEQCCCISNETARLQNQNQLLVMEIPRVKDEKECQQKLAVPSSWNGDAKPPLSPPRKIPTTHDSQIWMSSQTFKCTRNQNS